MRYYIIAGEHSGDLHGADLVVQIKKLDSCSDFWFCGGVAMQQAIGKPCNLNCAKMAYIGLDFVKKMYKIWRLLKFCQKNLIAYRPDVVVLIDYSGFNMRLAAFAKQNGFLVCYYIPPKIWAHGLKRIAKIKRDIAVVCATLPFEVSYYQNHGYQQIHYVGNPCVKKVANHQINPFFVREHGLDKRPIIALLPGSRWHEVVRILPIMVTQLPYFTSHQFVVAAVDHLPKSLYERLCPPMIKIIYNKSYDLLAMAQVAIVASGTASLEAALFDVVQIVVYKTGLCSYLLYKNIATIRHISLVNLLIAPAAVPELIQYQFTPQKLYAALAILLSENSKQKAVYQMIRSLLGSKDSAAETAKIVVSFGRKKYWL